MFSSLRQPRTSSGQDTPRLIPSIRLTSTTPMASAAPLAPKQNAGTARRVKPKRSIMIHQLPPELPTRRMEVHTDSNRADSTLPRLGPPPLPSSARLGSSSKVKVFVDPPRGVDDRTPQLVKKKKSRAALESIKWALGDRTNAAKDASGLKDDKEREPRSSIDSEKEREKWKWTLGRGRRDSKEKDRKGVLPGSQPSSVRLAAVPRGASSISSTYTLVDTPSIPAPNGTNFLSPILPPPSSLEPVSDASQPRTGSLAVRAMHSVRSMARISGWAARPGSPSPPKDQYKSTRSKKSKKGSIPILGSGESWLVDAPSSVGSSQQGEITGTVRPRPERTSSFEDSRRRTYSTLKFVPDVLTGRRTSTFSSSSGSSGESVMPRDSMSTSGASSNRSSSTRRSSTVSSSVLSITGSLTGRHNTAKTSTARGSKRGSEGSGTRRGALANVFDIARPRSSMPIKSSTVSSYKPPKARESSSSTSYKAQSHDSGSTESCGERVSFSSSTFAMVETPSDPFATSAGSYFPNTSVGKTRPVPVDEPVTAKNPFPSTTAAPYDGHAYVPGETPARQARPRPLSEQLLPPRPAGMVSDGSAPIGDGAIGLVSAATDELSDLINRLDLSTTPEPSPAKRWTPLSKHDPMPPLAMVTVERAIRRHWPDMHSSVAGKTDKSLESETLSQSLSVIPSLPRHTLASSGSIVDLQRARTDIFSTSLRPEPSLTSLRPYPVRRQQLAANATLRDGVTSMASPIDSKDTSFTIDSPLKNRTIRGARQGLLVPAVPKDLPEPRESSSVESLRAQLRPIASLEARRLLGMSGTLGEPIPDEDETDLNPSVTESDAESRRDSDIPDELQAILSSQSSNDSLRSSVGTFAFQRESVVSQSSNMDESYAVTSDGESMTLDEDMALSHARHFPFTAPPMIVLHDADLEDHSDDDRDTGAISEDDTGKKSFDFTGELNRLNIGGVRMSFVEQLETAFKTPEELLQGPSSPAESETSPISLNWDLPVAQGRVPKFPTGQMNPEFKFGAARGRSNTLTIQNGSKGRHSRTNTETSVLTERELSLLSELDASMVALANLNLSLVHPSSQTTFDPPPSAATTASFSSSATLQAPQVQSTDKSASHDEDASAYKIANPDLSLIHHSSAPQPERIFTNSNSSSIYDEDVSQGFERTRMLPIVSDTSSKREVRANQSQRSNKSHSRELSEPTMSSLGSILRPGVSDPFGYNKSSDISSGPPLFPLPPAPKRRHMPTESFASMVTMSSLGQVINPGSRNPFGYFRDHTRNISGISEFTVSAYHDMVTASNDISAFHGRKEQNRKSIDSDKSSFFFRSNEVRPPLPAQLFKHQDDSVSPNMSPASNSIGRPPMSYRRATLIRHQQNRLSNDSGSSIAHAYSTFGASGGRATWAKHLSGASVDSFMSDFSEVHIGRPGLGDKMLESAFNNPGAPLPSIMASPSASEAESISQGLDGMYEDEDIHGHAHQSSFDSSRHHRRSSVDSDSLFDEPDHASSVSSDSIFGADDLKPLPSHGMLFSDTNDQGVRPLSVFTIASIASSMSIREDDTMVPMLGGGYVPRKALAETFTASPSFKPKRKRVMPIQQISSASEDGEELGSPSKFATIRKKRQLTQRLAHSFGEETMAKATQGPFVRESLEDSALVLEADVSDFMEGSFSRPKLPAIQRNIFDPKPADGPSRPTTLVFKPAPPDSPPTSASASAYSPTDSQFSFDSNRLSANFESSQPSTMISNGLGARMRARGQGHRRRSSQIARASMIEAIAEEVPGLLLSSASSRSSVSSIISSAPSSAFDFMHAHSDATVEIAEHDDAAMGEMMRRYQALRKEALSIIQQSKSEWADTDFSRFAVSSFQPPQKASALQAFYDYSVRTYTPLPLELCIRRPRTNSRASPYSIRPVRRGPAPRMPANRQARTASMEIAFMSIIPPALDAIPPHSPFAIDRSFLGNNPTINESSEFGAEAQMTVRSRVSPKARRSALGGSKQHQRNSDLGGPTKSVASPLSRLVHVTGTAGGKENGSVFEGHGMLDSSNGSLRIARPRPRSRPMSLLASTRRQ